MNFATLPPEYKALKLYADLARAEDAARNVRHISLQAKARINARLGSMRAQYHVAVQQWLGQP